MSEPTNILDHLKFSWRDDIKERIKTEIEQRSDLDEIEYGQLLADVLSGCCGEFVYAHGQFWAFTAQTGLYQKVPEVELRNILYELNKARGHDGHRHQLSRVRINRIVAIAADKLTDCQFFEDARQGLATADGFLLLGSKIELKSHSPSYRARWKIPIIFNPLAETEPTEQRLIEITGSAENAQTFLEVLGVAMFGLGAHFGRMLVFVGEGANGKSTLVDIMRHIIPAPMRSSVPLSALKTEYDRVELDGKVLNTCEELPILSKIDVQLVKNIITGGDIQARQIGQQAFTMKPIAQHVVCTNNLPPLYENNEALRRRLIVIRLSQTIPFEKRDLSFAQKFFDAHKEPLLILATRALESALTRGRISEPNASKREVDRWLNHGDCVGSFLKEFVEHTGNPKDRIPVNEMYGACVRYANENGFPPPSSSREFGSRLEAAGFCKVKSSTMQWVGVRLRAKGWEDRED